MALIKQREERRRYRFKFRGDLATTETITSVVGIEVRSEAGEDITDQFEGSGLQPAIVESAKSLDFWLDGAESDEQQLPGTVRLFVCVGTSEGREIVALGRDSLLPLLWIVEGTVQ